MRPATRDKRRLFEEEALPHLDAIFSAAMYLTRNEDEANDLCQETMLRAYRFFDHYEAGTNCRAWLLTILRNISRTRHSRVSHERLAHTAEEFERAIATESLQGGNKSSNPESLYLRRAAGRAVQNALHALPDDFKAAVILVDIEELSYDEAAEVLAVPIGTVRSRISRGRALIRKALERVASSPKIPPPPKRKI
jgi:RNA polymerase sigma-70 factor (ECF subfamily)